MNFQHIENHRFRLILDVSVSATLAINLASVLRIRQVSARNLAEYRPPFPVRIDTVRCRVFLDGIP